MALVKTVLAVDSKKKMLRPVFGGVLVSLLTTKRQMKAFTRHQTKLMRLPALTQCCLG